jgi:hypothetical protein
MLQRKESKQQHQTLIKTESFLPANAMIIISTKMKILFIVEAPLSQWNLREGFCGDLLV